MRVEVVSPEKVLFSGDATQVITRTIEGGEIAFLPGHAAFLGALTQNHTRIYLADGSIQNLGSASWLSLKWVQTTCHDSFRCLQNLQEDIDVARARAAKARAEEQMRTEHSAEVEGDLRRAHARLAATGGIEASH
jgi:F-type H+-transporting ATPase subunit epsilon